MNQDDKRKAILALLLRAHGPVSIEVLQEQLRCGRRTVYYTVSKLNEELVAAGLEPVRNKRGQGYVLDDEQKRRIERMFAGDARPLYLRPHERLCYLVCWLQYPTEPIHVETIMQTLQVSRNTVFADLKQLKACLGEYDLQLAYEGRAGYAVVGQPLAKRTMLLYYLRLLLRCVQVEHLSFLDVADAESYYGRLVGLFDEMGSEYDANSLLAISCMLAIIGGRDEEFDFSVLEIDDLVSTDEYRLVTERFGELSEYEQLYLAIQLLGWKAGRAIKVDEHEDDVRLFELAQRVTSLFEHMARVSLVDKPGLVNSLYMHFKLSMYYYRLSMQTLNPLLRDVQENYFDLYQLVKSVCTANREAFPFPLVDDEIAYIAVHVGAHLIRTEGRFYRNVRVLVVCPSGIATSALLRKEIERLYSNVTVVATATVADVGRYRDVDLIVSTVAIESDIPWINVNSILTASDKARIASMLMLNFETYELDEGQMGTLFDLLGSYVPKERMNDLKRDVYRYFRQGNPLVRVRQGRTGGIADLLGESDVQIVRHGLGWREAIERAARPLLERNVVGIEYVEAMLELVEDYGPYIVLGESVALAHAPSNHGVNAAGLALLVCPDGISFEGGVEVRFLFVLASVEQEKQLRLLREIMALSQNGGLRESLLACGSTPDILEALQLCAARNGYGIE